MSWYVDLAEILEHVPHVNCEILAVVCCANNRVYVFCKFSL